MKQHTYTGIIDFDDIKPYAIKAVDFIPALCRINRWAGATHKPFSVGQHTLFCLYIADILEYTMEQKLALALHDAAEAYTGDIPSAVKKILGDPYYDLTHKINKAIAAKFGLYGEQAFETVALARVDRLALIFEGRALIPHLDFDLVHNEEAGAVNEEEQKKYEEGFRKIADLTLHTTEASYFSALQSLVMN